MRTEAQRTLIHHEFDCEDKMLSTSESKCDCPRTIYPPNHERYK